MNSTVRLLVRECALILALAAVPATLTYWLHAKHSALTWTKPPTAQVELGEVTRWTPPVLWVDAREAAAYDKAHMPGAILLNETEWNRLIPGFLDAWRPGVKVVVYCDAQDCNSSVEVARRLQSELSVEDIYVLKGGWASWKSQHP